MVSLDRLEVIEVLEDREKLVLVLVDRLLGPGKLNTKGVINLRDAYDLEFLDDANYFLHAFGYTNEQV